MTDDGWRRAERPENGEVRGRKREAGDGETQIKRNFWRLNDFRQDNWIKWICFFTISGRNRKDEIPLFCGRKAK